jgi:phosphoesterase RecJ-like protein
MDKIIKKIQDYSQILLYRHVNPDMDAFGSQLGFYHFIKEHFPSKHVVLMGEFTSALAPMFINEEREEIRDEKSLGIVLDTANKERIDGDLSLCEYVIKIDHHIVVDSYGDINIEDVSASSCAQIVSLLFKEGGFMLNKEASRALYIGIIGDSNRFLYRNTGVKTFEAASYLLESGIDIEAIYQDMYLREEKDLNVTRFILNHYVKEGRIAYYVLKDEDLKELEISREEGSNYVNTLSNIKEFDIWMAITENTKDNNIRVSIRSRKTAINEVAAQFNGGGHALASGAKLSSFDELPELIKALKNAQECGC